jgi:large conductance mechanosensitive channel
MALFKEFRTFAMRGNVVDVAVGVIIGAAFGKIVSSLVEDVITPPIGLLVGGVDFSKLTITLAHAHGETPEVVLRYGEFLQAVVDFTIIAWALFLLVKVINRLRRQDEKADAPALTKDQALLTEIRDLLRTQPKPE